MVPPPQQQQQEEECFPLPELSAAPQIKRDRVCFGLRRSPDHGTVKVVFVVGGGGGVETIFTLCIFLRYENLYKIRFVNTSDYTNYAKFGNLVTKTFSENGQMIFKFYWFCYAAPMIYHTIIPLSGLDMFAHFFISPLMRQDSMTREREAIDNEFKLAMANDSNRKRQVLIAEAAKKGCPIRSFAWGNRLSLKPKNVSSAQPAIQYPRNFLYRFCVRFFPPLPTIFRAQNGALLKVPFCPLPCYEMMSQ